MSGSNSRPDEHDRPLNKEAQPAVAEEFVLLLGTCMIHRASCSLVPSELPLDDGSAELSDLVFRSKNVAELEHALLQIEGAVHACSVCEPGSDPPSVGLLTSYGNNMRSKLRRERGRPA